MRIYPTYTISVDALTASQVDNVISMYVLDDLAFLQ